MATGGGMWPRDKGMVDREGLNSHLNLNFIHRLTLNVGEFNHGTGEPFARESPTILRLCKRIQFNIK